MDHDVLLVRKVRNIKVQETGGANSETMLEVPLAGGALGTLAIPRGYVDANVKVRGEKLHVVNTHLQGVRRADPQRASDHAGVFSRLRFP